MEMMKKQAGFGEICRSVGCRMILWGVLFVGFLVVSVALPLVAFAR